jgi:hypothetical protein
MPLSRDEIKKRMVELARKYVETHDKEIIKELYKLARELEKINKLEKQWRSGLTLGARVFQFIDNSGTLKVRELITDTMGYDHAKQEVPSVCWR